MSFLFGANKKSYYNYFYIASIIVAVMTPFSMMLDFIDGVFALMAIPTMLSTLILAPKVISNLKDYKMKLKNNEL